MAGALTRGRGMTETQHHLWVLSMPACAGMNESLPKLTGVSFETSDQHKDMSESRQARDVNDAIALISYLRDSDPFALNTCSLFNIATGMTAQEGGNAELARHIGESILISMIGQSFDDFVFCKAAQAVPLGAKTFMKGNGEAVLADTIWKALKSEQKQPSDNVQYILDGGALLHHLPWPRGSTYDSLCDQYVRYVTQKYGAAIIVFDGYREEPTTKDATHLRSSTCTGLNVHFTGRRVVQSKKEFFLQNPINKQRFVHHVIQKLQMAGCRRDLLIVQTAIALARQQQTVLIGDDTDVLVLLLYHG